MSGATPPQAEDPKVRRTWIVGGGISLGLGVLLAGLIGAGGASGRAGLVGFLLGAAVGTSIGALYGFGSAALDAVRGRVYTNARIVAAGVLFGLSLLLTVMVAGMGG